MTALLAPPLPRTTQPPRRSRRPEDVSFDAYAQLLDQAFLALIEPPRPQPISRHGNVLTHLVTANWSRPTRFEVDRALLKRLALALGEAVIQQWYEITEHLARVTGMSAEQLRSKAFKNVDPPDPAEVEAIVADAFGEIAGEDLGLACADLDTVTGYMRPFLDQLSDQAMQERSDLLYELTGSALRAALLVAAVLRGAASPDLRTRADRQTIEALCEIARHDVADLWGQFKLVFGETDQSLRPPA